MINAPGCETALNEPDRNPRVARSRIHAHRCVRILLATLITKAMMGAGSFETHPKSPQELDDIAQEIVLGVVVKRSVEEAVDGPWVERRFTYEVRVEESLGKGDLEQGDLIEVAATNRRWTSPDPMPPSETGHFPLPVVGELARFHLLRISGERSYMPVVPNGVELSMDADLDDPTRVGDPGIPEIVDSEPEQTGVKDPFGWDVVLLLLAIPLVVGSLRQAGRARWILLSIASMMLGGAILLVML